MVILEILMLGLASSVIIGLVYISIVLFTVHTRETLFAVGAFCILSGVVLLLGTIAKYLLVTFGR